MKVIYIEWEDAATTYGWCEADDISGLLPIKTVGFLIKETPQFYSVSTSYHSGDRSADPISIPKAWVQKKKFIKIS